MLPERRQLVRIIRYLSKEKLARLLKYAENLDDELTPEDMADIKAAKAEIGRGEWVSLDEIKRREGL